MSSLQVIMAATIHPAAQPNATAGGSNFEVTRTFKAQLLKTPQSSQESSAERAVRGDIPSGGHHRRTELYAVP